MNANTCLTTEQLSALLEGSLTEAAQDELHEHLDRCLNCQSALEELAAGRVSWACIGERLTADPAGNESALHDLMNRLAGATMQAETFSDGGNCGLSGISLDFLAPSEHPTQLGKLGPYEILEVIGRGAFGIVLKALDPKLGRVVAIKVLAPHFATSASARRRFNREARSAAAVSHESVVAIHSVVDDHHPPYIVMAHVAGQSLQQKLDRQGPLGFEEILRIGVQAARGLAAAHAQGLVHRDIKPANILLEEGSERIKLTDFGLARAADDASLTQSGVIAGTPQFMAPEQARGELVDHRADLFSLGSVLYAMCTGRPPFRASTTMGVLKRVCDESPRPIRDINPEIPEWFSNIVAKLHAKKPAERFQSAREVAELLAGHLAHLQQPALNAMPSPVTVPASSSLDERRSGECTITLEAKGAGTGRGRNGVWSPLLLAATLGLVLIMLLGTPLLLVLGWYFLSLGPREPNDGLLIARSGPDGDSQPSVPSTPPPEAVGALGVNRFLARPELQGFWVPVAAEKHGQPVPEDVIRRTICGGLLIDGERWGSVVDGRLQEGVLKLERVGEYDSIEFIGSIFNPQIKGRGICRIEADRLILCLAAKGKEFPTTFATDSSTDSVTVIYQKDTRGLEASRTQPFDLHLLQGAWRSADPGTQDLNVVFVGNNFEFKALPGFGQAAKGGKVFNASGSLEIDPATRRISVIDPKDGHKRLVGLYQLDGDNLKLCYRFDPPDEKFPAQMADSSEGAQVVTLKRAVSASQVAKAANLREVAMHTDRSVLGAFRRHNAGQASPCELLEAECASLSAHLELAEAEHRPADAAECARTLLEKLEKLRVLAPGPDKPNQDQKAATNIWTVAMSQTRDRLVRLESGPEEASQAQAAQTPMQTWREAIGAKVWPNGTTLTVAFVDKEARRPDLEELVRSAAAEWARYVNLNFEFVGQDASADVRVSFNRAKVPQKWRDADVLAALGTDGLDRSTWPDWSLYISPDLPVPERQAMILHEWGHVLGFVHEQDRVRPEWDEDAVYEAYRLAWNWPRTRIYANVIAPRYRLEGSDLDRFDPESIMVQHHKGRPVLKGGGFLKLNSKLSPQDKRLASEFYPGRWSP